MGFVEETGIAQFYRDARITTIYEGTTGIQGQDLVGRKFLANGGEVVADYLAEIQATAGELSTVDALADLGVALTRAVDDSHTACQWLLAHAADDRYVAGAASVNFMMMLGFVSGAWVLGQSALKAEQLLRVGQGDKAFLSAKLVTARFYSEHLLPRAACCLSAIQAGSASIMDLGEEQF